jgi:acetyl-CoA carboxylase biotin carboxylase subunit
MTDELRQNGWSSSESCWIHQIWRAGNGRVFVDKHVISIYGNEYAYSSRAPITEQVIDYDLIREQILVAAGVPISGKIIYQSCTL